MTSALVGSTGFVGGNLAGQRSFDHLYNSRNAPQIAGRRYDLLVFSAARAEKWRINQEPEADLRHIHDLERLLASVEADRLVLISTVDVYAHPVDVDEHTPVSVRDLHAYGRHRFQLEEFARASENFGSVHVLRLPGLFGPGLKKNVIYDLMNDNHVDRIHADGEFQYYDLRRIWGDIEKMLDQDLRLLNMATEPVRTADLAREAFGYEFENRPEGVSAGRYDFASVHASKWGGERYLYDRDSVLHDVADFVRSMS